MSCPDVGGGQHRGGAVQPGGHPERAGQLRQVPAAAAATPRLP